MRGLKLIVVSGLPGAGKSTVARGLARKLELPMFSVDPVESSIIRSGIRRSFETGLAAYLVVEALASEQLDLGLSAVIDAVSPVTESRKMWEELSTKHSVKLVNIECTLDSGLHKERRKARVRNLRGIPEVTWDDVEQRRKEYIPWESERLVLDTSNSTEANLKTALEYIEARG